MQHIQQIGVLWRNNSDVINLVDPGFIGGWGEWHTSSNGLDTPENEATILNAILGAMPEERMTCVNPLH